MPERDHPARLETHLAGGLAHARDFRLDLEKVASVDRRQKLDGGVRAEEPLVPVVPDEQFRSGVAEELEHERAVHETPAVVRLLGAHAQAQDGALRTAQDCAPETPWRRESSSSRKAAARDAVVPGPKPAS